MKKCEILQLLKYQLNIADVGARFIAPIIAIATQGAINRAPTIWSTAMFNWWMDNPKNPSRNTLVVVAVGGSYSRSRCVFSGVCEKTQRR
jgi:hypothetical protein